MKKDQLKHISNDELLNEVNGRVWKGIININEVVKISTEYKNKSNE